MSLLGKKVYRVVNVKKNVLHFAVLTVFLTFLSLVAHSYFTVLYNSFSTVPCRAFIDISDCR